MLVFQINKASVSVRYSIKKIIVLKKRLATKGHINRSNFEFSKTTMYEILNNTPFHPHFTP